MRGWGRAAVVCLGAPMLAASLATAWVVAADCLELHPAEAAGPMNLAEAAASGHAAEVVRRLRHGESPSGVYAIRPHIISAEVRRATVFEAAMWSRRLEMIRLLESEGAAVPEASRDMLACLASDLGLPEIALHVGGGTMPACVPGRAWKMVASRTAGEDVP